MKKHILIVNKKQYGYHTSTYKYTQNFKNEFDVTYICFDKNLKKFLDSEVKIIYVPNTKSFALRGFHFIQTVIKYIKSNEIDLIFIGYFQMASYLKIKFPRKKFILNITTGSVARKRLSRIRHDSIMRLECYLFNHITIISESLRIKLKLKSDKCQILPLGSDVISKTEKSFDKLKMIYVGSLNYRNIHETILGLKLFIKNNDYRDITYDIFGTGFKEIEISLKNMIELEDLTEIIKMHGRLSHDELVPFFDKCNVGISYVPITDYYDCQPPTKTYEYINSGMVCIATNTKENIKLINEDNGILCTDNPISFSKSLEKLYLQKERYKSKKIAATLLGSDWQQISNDLAKYMNGLMIK